MNADRVLIVGGGIAGLVAATAIAQSGRPVTLLEAADAFGDIGAGVTLSPNAMRGLAFIAVEPQVVAAGMEPAAQRIQHWRDGRVLVAVDRASTRERYGAPYVYIHRADLHAVLVEAARAAGATLFTGARVDSVAAGRVTLHDGRVFEADVLIGADGLKSVVRKLFEAQPAHFTGYVAWRALVAVDDERLAALSDWPGIHIGPDRMVTRYPVRGGTLLNLVFFARQAGWNEDGWSIPAQADDLRATFAGWCDEIGTLIDAVAGGPLYKWAINARTALPDWVHAGQVALMGDAAHAMTPFLGQGAACAIEDAVVLSRALADAPTTALALRRFVDARHARTSFIQQESNANAVRMQGGETDLYGLGNLQNEETLGLFQYDCRTVPV